MDIANNDCGINTLQVLGVYELEDMMPFLLTTEQKFVWCSDKSDMNERQMFVSKETVINTVMDLLDFYFKNCMSKEAFGLIKKLKKIGRIEKI